MRDQTRPDGDSCREGHPGDQTPRIPAFSVRAAATETSETVLTANRTTNGGTRMV